MSELKTPVIDQSHEVMHSHVPSNYLIFKLRGICRLGTQASVRGLN